jgi:dienelactone hydrolase
MIQTCETDQQFPKEKQEMADKLFGDQPNRYKRNYFPGQTHGFAVRGDFSKPENKKAHDDAFRASYEWIASKL